ncbi:MAG TPA: hypothetical protein PKA03_13835 [Tabrizicola sp.]|nr:hypothetical protein [Tabrizicola sp.]
MRLAAYLSASRHGIFYFRYPLPMNRAGQVHGAGHLQLVVHRR